ncbi:MAG: transcriptional regulator [Marinilabiliales bacterium]|nr:MAG: transcriptional regulator [Marinilabiliales bacterium]
MKTYHLNGTIYYCPVDLTLSVIGGRWKGLIIWSLRQEAPLRFNELKKRLVTINDKMLSQTLKQLVEQDIIIRKSYNEIPPKVEYSLSETGIQLLPIFELMQEWGEKNNTEL